MTGSQSLLPLYSALWVLLADVYDMSHSSDTVIRLNSSHLMMQTMQPENAAVCDPPENDAANPIVLRSLVLP